jgi:hypothetical protein
MTEAEDIVKFLNNGDRLAKPKNTDDLMYGD